MDNFYNRVHDRTKGTGGSSRNNSGEAVGADFVVIRAEENGVTVIGLTRGPETRFSHTEKLDEGEVWISQFTEHTSAIKVRGSATIYSKHGVVRSGRS